MMKPSKLFANMKTNIAQFFLSAIGSIMLTLAAEAASFSVQISTAAGGVDFSSERKNEAGEVSGSSHYSIARASSSAYAYASAETGVFKLQAKASAESLPKVGLFGHEPYANSQASAQARFRDSMTINAPGLAGKAGRATVSLFIPGSIEGSSSFDSRGWGGQLIFGIGFPGGGAQFVGNPFDLMSGSGLLRGAVGNALHPSESYSLPLVDGRFDFDITFQYGHRIDFDMNSSAFAEMQARNGTSGFVDIDYANSLYWAGLSAVSFDGNLLPAGTFTALSPEGVDYAKSFVPVTTGVPETGASLGLLILSLSALVCARRRDKGVVYS